MSGKFPSGSAANGFPTFSFDIQSKCLALYEDLINHGAVAEGNSSAGISHPESIATSLSNPAVSNATFYQRLAYNTNTLGHQTANLSGQELFGPQYEGPFGFPLCYRGIVPSGYNPVKEDGMHLDPPQLQQAQSGRIMIDERLTDGEEVQIHHTSPVPSCSGGTISLPYHSQPGYQVGAQPVTPLTGPSDETTIRVVGTPDCIVDNIANVSLDPRLIMTRQGMMEKMSKSPYLNPNVFRNMFRKFAKKKVTSYKARLASNGRRRDIAKFECTVEGCDSSFTRKHNLTNHRKSHLGITDYFCSKCEKGFTTCATMRRHEKKCSLDVASSSKAPMTSEALAQIQKVVRSSLNQP